jgi:nucleoside-diphosphate-sugar epimerase
MKRALVTGGAGFIGSNLTHALVNDDWVVDVVDDMSSGHLTQLDGLNYRVFLPGMSEIYEMQKTRGSDEVFVHECDFSHPVILEKIASKHYDVVFHQAAVPRVSYSVEEPVLTTDVNLLRSVELLRACVGNVSRVVVASTCAVYGDTESLPTSENAPHKPKSPYALQKSTLEKYCTLFSDLYQLDTVCLRYFNVFGPGQYGDSPYSTAVAAWCDAIKNGRPLRSDGDGSQSRDMCYVDNVTSANILAAKSNMKMTGNVYNICSGSRVENRQILAFLKDKFTSIEVTSAPWRPGDIMHTQGDCSLAHKELGYEPSISFWDGLEKTLAWWEIK